MYRREVWTMKACVTYALGLSNTIIVGAQLERRAIA